MVPVQAVARTTGIGVICIALTACYFPDMGLGGAKTAAQLAPSLHALREVAPEHHRRLANGTFESMSLQEQLNFVAEVREIVRKQRDAEREDSRVARRQSTVEFLDHIESLPPESAERSLVFRREGLLRDLKMESDQLFDAQTGADLVPSLQPLHEAAPEHYRRLADGTFDSLSFMEQWDFVAEIREIVREQRETERAQSEEAWRQSMVEFLDSIEVVPPESREQRLASRRAGLLLRLKLENDSLSKQRAFFPMFGTFEFSGK